MLETVLESCDGTAETLAGVFGDQLWTGMRLSGCSWRSVCKRSSPGFLILKAGHMGHARVNQARLGQAVYH